MKRMLTILMLLMIASPSSLFAGYIFHQKIDSDGKKNNLVYFIEGTNKKVDVYMDGELHTTVISSPKRKTPLYLMHDTETYMTKMPGLDQIPTSFPEMKYEPTKKPINPAEEIVKAMDDVERTENRIEYFKNDPRNAAYEAMTDLAYEVEARQQEKMMKEQMAKVMEIQKKMVGQMEQQQRMLKKSTEKNIKRKNAILISNFKIKPTTKTKKIGKYKTKLVQVYYKGEHFQDCWVSKEPGTDAAKAISALYNDSKLGSQELVAYYTTMKKLNDKISLHGCPVLTVSHYKGLTKILYGAAFDGGAPVKVQTELTKFEKKSIKSTSFKIPKGYEEYKVSM